MLGMGVFHEKTGCVNKKDKHNSNWNSNRDMKMLNGKTVLIAGATGGIGAPICRVLHSRGANVVLFARRREKLDALHRELGDKGVLVVSGDACDPVAVRKALFETEKKFGRLDAVVIVVGTWGRLSTENSIEEAAESIDHLYKTILLPTVVMGQGALKDMLNQPAGSVIFHISSHASIRPYLKGNLSYGAVKAAAEAFFERVRREIGDSHVKIVDIRPATVNTVELPGALSKSSKAEEMRKKGATQEKINEWIAEMCKLAVQPEEIAAWIAENVGNKKVPSSMLFDSELVLD